MPVRKNVVNLPAAERAALVAAITAMKTSGRYDTYVVSHKVSVDFGSTEERAS
jgi:hypothetical protein